MKTGKKLSKVLVPASCADDWKKLLADPGKQWKSGYSAHALAHCWQKADGIPKDVLRVLKKEPALKDLKAIFVIPEHKVPLPGGSKASQNDVWVLAETSDGLVSIAVEGKVSESFGPTVGAWLKNKTSGKEERLKFLCSELDLKQLSLDIRYQLLHRTVSAIIEAKRFHAHTAVMLVHSFSETNKGFEDYKKFISLFGLKAGVNESASKIVGKKEKINLIFAWINSADKDLDS